MFLLLDVPDWPHPWPAGVTLKETRIHLWLSPEQDPRQQSYLNLCATFQAAQPTVKGLLRSLAGQPGESGDTGVSTAPAPQEAHP